MNKLFGCYVLEIDTAAAPLELSWLNIETQVRTFYTYYARTPRRLPFIIEPLKRKARKRHSMIEKGSRHEYIARTNDISYPKDMEDYLEKAYPKNPDLFTDEVFQRIFELTETYKMLLEDKSGEVKPEVIVDDAIEHVKTTSSQPGKKKTRSSQGSVSVETQTPFLQHPCRTPDP